MHFEVEFTSQMLALESALGRNFTAIWGPPGTGKTYTIGTIAQFLYESARTVLIVSHTNTAVDQAIKEVAKAMPENLEQGDVIRVGDVRSKELEFKFPYVLLKKQVERQSRELFELRDNLFSQKQVLSDEISSVQKEISIIEWVGAVKIDIESTKESVEELYRHQEQLFSAERALTELESRRTQLLELHERLARVLTNRKKLTIQYEEKARLEGLLSLNASKYRDTNIYTQEQERRLDILRRIAPLRQERVNYPTAVEQKSIITILSGRMVELKKGYFKRSVVTMKPITFSNNPVILVPSCGF